MDYINETLTVSELLNKGVADQYCYYLCPIDSKFSPRERHNYAIVHRNATPTGVTSIQEIKTDKT